jgi:hypothetical protein
LREKNEESGARRIGREKGRMEKKEKTSNE